LLHKQDGSGELQSRFEYCPIRLLKQVCPHDGKDEIAARNVEVEDVVLTEVPVLAVEELVRLLVVVVEELFKLLIVVVGELFVIVVVVVVVIVEELNEELITVLHVPHPG
jgi:hypothetical protein